jgi:hypothetical protein
MPRRKAGLAGRLPFVVRAILARATTAIVEPEVPVSIRRRGYPHCHVGWRHGKFARSDG